MLIKKKNKKQLEFANLCLQQEIKVSNKSLWVSHFSVDGEFFATGGVDSKLRIWQVNDYSEQCNY
jgi:WD40 repeat protein